MSFFLSIIFINIYSDTTQVQLRVHFDQQLWSTTLAYSRKWEGMFVGYTPVRANRHDSKTQCVHSGHDHYLL